MGPFGHESFRPDYFSLGHFGLILDFRVGRLGYLGGSFLQELLTPSILQYK